MSKNLKLSFLVLILVLLSFFVFQNKEKFNFFKNQTVSQKIEGIDSSETINIIKLGISPKGKYIYYILTKGGRHYLKLNEEIYGPYDEILDVIFSKNDSKYGWVYKLEDYYFFQFNGSKFGPYRYIYEAEFSDDGSLFGFAYEVWKDSNGFHTESYANIGGEIYGPFSWVSIYFPPKSSKYFLIIEKEDGRYVKSGNKTYGPYNTLYEIASLENDKIYGWSFKDFNNRYYIYFSGKIYGPYFYYAAGPFVSKNGLSFGFVFSCGKDEFYVCFRINDKIYGPYKDPRTSLIQRPYMIVFSPNGSSYAYSVMEGNSKGHLVINGKKFGPYDFFSLPIFSDDGLKFVFWFENDGKYFIQTNEKTYGDYEYISDFKISSDGSKIAWVFKKEGKEHLQINDKIYKTCDLIDFIFDEKNNIKLVCAIKGKVVKEDIDKF